MSAIDSNGFEPSAFSIPEVMLKTGLGRDTVYRLVREGKLVARKVGKRTLVTSVDLQAFLAALPRIGDGRAA
jgi:excisionase family DNA binding protein